MNFSEKIILALDVDTTNKAYSLVEQTAGLVGYYKVGLGFLARGGLELASNLVKDGHKVFLDVKLFDIHQTIEDAVARLADIGIHIMTLHGDPHVIKAAVSGRTKAGRDNHLKLFGVTVLTSLDQTDLDDMGFQGQSIADVVLRRAGGILKAGANGVIASSHEAKLLKQSYPALEVITPGIRLTEGEHHDQKRVMTPTQALTEGADYLVIGRQITHSSNPKQMAQTILDHIAQQLG